MPFRFNPFTGNFDRVGPGSGAAAIETLTGNIGGAVGPDGSFNINILGEGKYFFEGDPGSNTLSLDDDGTIADSFTADTGIAVPSAGNLNIFGDTPQGIETSGSGATISLTNLDASEIQKGVSELATDAEAIAGTDSTRTIVPTSLKAKLGVQTSNAIPFGQGDTLAFGWTSALTNGQLVIGSTAGTPAAANLTAGSGILISNGSNIITISTTASVPTSFVADAGSATPAGNILNILGGTLINTAGATNVVTINADDNVVGSVDADSGTATPTSNSFTISGSGSISTSGSGDTITISSSGGGFTWLVETGTTADLAADTGNIGNNAAGVTFTLPATCTVGDTIIVTGLQASWTIAQNAGQTIHFGSSSTTTGAGGSLASTDARDVVTMVCVVTDTDFQILSSIGNITVT